MVAGGEQPIEIEMPAGIVALQRHAPGLAAEDLDAGEDVPGQTGVTQTALSPAPTSVWMISIMAFMPLEVTAIRSSAISTL